MVGPLWARYPQGSLGSEFQERALGASDITIVLARISGLCLQPQGFGYGMRMPNNAPNSAGRNDPIWANACLLMCWSVSGSSFGIL
jgi:hypothetical protein